MGCNPAVDYGDLSFSGLRARQSCLGLPRLFQRNCHRLLIRLRLAELAPGPPECFALVQLRDVLRDYRRTVPLFEWHLAPPVFSGVRSVLITSRLAIFYCVTFDGMQLHHPPNDQRQQ